MHPQIEYFWKRTEPLPWSGCWIWLGSTTNGYGKYGNKNGNALVHRTAYTILKGPIKENLQIDHKCRNKACWNPDHLEAVTQRENLRRGTGFSGVNARKTHCKNGHLLDGNNVYFRSDRPGTRECRICRLSYAKTYNKENWWRYS